MFKPFKTEGMSIFLVVWFGQLVSLLGSELSNFALDVWVYQKNNSVTQLSFLILFTTLPLVIVSPFAGVLVDRWNRRWVMILSDTGAALSTLTVAILLLTGEIQIWHIYLASVVISSFSVFQWPAYSAATTLLVPEKYLGRASGMIQFSKALGRLLSPILGSILLGVIQLSGIFVLDLSSFIFAFIALFLVRFPCHKVTQDPINNKISIFAQLLYGFNYLKSRSALIALLLFFATTYFVFGIVQVLTYPLILSFASEVQLGKIMTLGGMGMITATLFISIRGIRGQNYINVIFYFMLLQGFSIMLAGFYPSVILLAIAAFLFFLTVPFVNCSFQVIFQKKIAPDVQGRVFSLNNAILGLSLLLSYFTAGPLADRIFEPLMAVNTPLAKTIGQFIGAGTGRGIGLMFIVLGGLTILITIIAYQYAPLRLVEGKDSSDNS